MWYLISGPPQLIIDAEKHVDNGHGPLPLNFSPSIKPQVFISQDFVFFFAYRELTLNYTFITLILRFYSLYLPQF